MKFRVPHRPYSQIRGTEPSVTTILEMLPKPGLPWGSARETALFAYLHPEKWQHLPVEQAVNVLRKHHKGIWDSRAAMGTYFVHGVAEAFDADEEINVEKILDETIEFESDARLWKERDRDDLIEECLGYELGVERFWAEFQPTNRRAEVVVRWPGLFIGQTDLRCDIDFGHGPEDTLVDFKSTAKQDEGSGIYNDSWTFQLAMYGMARETVQYELRPDKKLKSGMRLVETGTGPWSRPQRYMIVHLRGDENYTPFEIQVTRADERTAFRLARAYPGWKSVPEKPGVFVRPRVVTSA